MNLEIDVSDKYNDTEINIRCPAIDEEVNSVINLINGLNGYIIVKRNDKTEKLRFNSICYFESVDEQTFVYTEKDVYRCKEKLYEIEDMFRESSFIRISKACILNIDYLESVKTSFNGKLEAKLLNGERIIINRHYVSGFKKKFGL